MLAGKGEILTYPEGSKNLTVNMEAGEGIFKLLDSIVGVNRSLCEIAELNKVCYGLNHVIRDKADDRREIDLMKLSI